MPDETKLAAIRDTVDAVRALGVDPESQGGAVLLAYLLEQPNAPVPVQRSAGADNIAARSAPPAVSREPAVALDGGPAQRLAEWAGADVDRIEDIIEFAEGEPLIRFPVGRLPAAKAHRQRALVLLKLAAERVAYERVDVPGSSVNATCADYNCMDQNMPNNVLSHGDFVTRRGKRGAYIYRITQPGVQRARELLQQYFTTDEEVRA